jgi:hypothetical protein
LRVIGLSELPMASTSRPHFSHNGFGKRAIWLL